ncbi:hypothetical protein KIPB_012029, partial [Kipferlia bialata]
SPPEIKRLYRRFMKLDKQRTGQVNVDSLTMIPELGMNPLANRVLEVLDENNDELINFKDFLLALSVFHSDASKAEKLAFAFKIYDVDNDGAIGEDDLMVILSELVGQSLSHHQLVQLVAKTIRESDVDKDGMLSLEEFT